MNELQLYPTSGMNVENIKLIRQRGQMQNNVWSHLYKVLKQIKLQYLGIDI